MLLAKQEREKAMLLAKQKHSADHVAALKKTNDLKMAKRERQLKEAFAVTMFDSIVFHVIDPITMPSELLLIINLSPL